MAKKSNDLKLSPLPFGEKEAISCNSIQVYEDFLSSFVPSLVELNPTNKENFKSKMHGININGFEIASMSGHDCKLNASDFQETLQLIFLTEGSNETYNENKKAKVIARKNALFTNMLTGAEDKNNASGFVAKINIEKLKQIYLGMTGIELTNNDFRFDEMKGIDLVCGTFSFDDVFRKLCNLIDIYSSQEDLLGYLKVDELFYRNIIMMLMPEKFFGKHEINIKNKKTNEGLDRILDFNKQFPLELLTIGDMERISGLSARTIQYLFQAKLGCTPIKWLRNKRLEIAKNLILSTNISITELSLKLGFPSLSIFSKYYKEYFNELPSQTSKKS